jgi:hypothetical protein
VRGITVGKWYRHNVHADTLLQPGDNIGHVLFSFAWCRS